MGLRSGDKKEKRFGEQEAGGIEGLELLENWKEEQRKKRLAEKGLPSDAEEDEEDEAANWAAWNVEDDEDSDDSGGWINVQSDDEIELSDSEDEKGGPPSKKAKQEEEAAKTNPETTESKPEPSKPSIATTRILTPADLAKLQELRTEAAVNDLVSGGKPRRGQQTSASRHTDDPLTAEEIEGLNALSAGKLTREERIAHAKEGKTDRAEHKSVTAKRKERKEEQGKSTTNKEKARKKNFLMTLGKARSKGKRSLVETRNVLRAHQDRQKRGGRRGNFGN